MLLKLKLETSGFVFPYGNDERALLRLLKNQGPEDEEETENEEDEEEGDEDIVPDNDGDIHRVDEEVHMHDEIYY